MKKSIFTVARLALIFGLTVSASAQAGPVQAKIPFSFTVFGKTLSAGDYSISAASHIIKIRDANYRIVAMASANELSDRAAGEKGHLLFHCYQDRCFLAEIWFGAHDNGLQLFTSREEAILAREQKGKYFAVLWQKGSRSK
jgi:hypothetical protein